MEEITVFEEILNWLTLETSDIFVEQWTVQDTIHLDLIKIGHKDRYFHC